MRSDFGITVAQPPLTVGGWYLRPKIVSSEIRQQANPPAPPDQFTIALWAVHPMPATGLAEAIEDISADSVRVTFPPGTRNETLVFNEAAFISYRSVSRDSIVKRFTVVDSQSQGLTWLTFPPDANTLLLDLYVTTRSGKFAPREPSATQVGFDSILPLGENRKAITLTTMVVRSDHLSSGVGLVGKPNSAW